MRNKPALFVCCYWQRSFTSSVRFQYLLWRLYKNLYRTMLIRSCSVVLHQKTMHTRRLSGSLCNFCHLWNHGWYQVTSVSGWRRRQHSGQQVSMWIFDWQSDSDSDLLFCKTGHHTLVRISEFTTGYTLPLRGFPPFYFPWHRHQIDGITGTGLFRKLKLRHVLWGERNCLGLD